MKMGLIRLARGALHATLLLAFVATSMPASASNWGARREGMREISASATKCAERFSVQGSRAGGAPRISRRNEGNRPGEERNEARSSPKFVMAAGIETVIAPEISSPASFSARSSLPQCVVQRAPPPPTPGLYCWYWFDAYQQNGYWDRCGAY